MADDRERTFTWDCRQQPPMDEIAAAVAEMSGGSVRMSMPETGTDEYRLIVSAPGVSDLVAIGNGPLLDQDCRCGEHASCLGAPCECPVPGVHSTRHEHERSQP